MNEKTEWKPGDRVRVYGGRNAHLVRKAANPRSRSVISIAWCGYYVWPDSYAAGPNIKTCPECDRRRRAAEREEDPR